MQDDVIDDLDHLMAAAKCLKERGAYRVCVVATHGIFTKAATELLEHSDIDEVHTYIHTYTYIHIHTYIHTYSGTSVGMCLLCLCLATALLTYVSERGCDVQFMGESLLKS